MSANSSTEAQPKRQLDWYDNIENIRPVRGGHSAASVMAAASAPPLTVTEAREKFHNSLKEAGSACDPLAVLISFIKWFDDHFLSGKVSVLHPMLYQILTKYGTEPRYRNDERIMKLWLRLADNFPERGFAVMQLACSRGSCRELAKFYIFWSKMYEYAEQMDRAREILARGIYNRASPISDLHEASDALELRICRWTMEKQKKEDDCDFSDDDDLNFIETRKVFRKFEVEETKLGYRAPTVRDDTSTPKKVKINPQIKADFEIFVDDNSDDYAPTNSSNFVIPKIEDELSSDPDWQCIFGYTDNPNLHIDITENTVPREKMGTRGVPGIKPPPPCADEPLAAFSVYCDAQKAKVKSVLRRELIRELSIEEAYLQRLTDKNEHHNVEPSTA